jgi:hypothetical protein
MVQNGPLLYDITNPMTHTSSFLADSPSFGAAYYADFGSPDNFLSGPLSESAPANSVAGIGTATGNGGRIDTGLGYFPTPLRGINPSLIQDASCISVAPTKLGPAGSEWLYLPFPKKDIFGSVSVEAKIFSFSGATNSVSQITAVSYGGIMVAPAYDAREIITADSTYPLTAPVYQSGTGAFRNKSLGIVRRTPWILTPYGMGRRIAFSGLTENSYYYDPSNGTGDAAATYDPYKFFTRSLADYAAAPLARTTRFSSGNIAGNDSYLIRGALPFYDRRRAETVAGGAKVAGVVLNAAQMNSFSGVRSAIALAPTATTTPTQGYSFMSCGGAVSLMDRYTPSADPTRQAFLTCGGAAPRTPDGIAVCMQRWDFGIAGKFGGPPPNPETGTIYGTVLPPTTASVAPGANTGINNTTTGVTPYGQGHAAATKFIEAPIAIYLKITGTVIDRFKLAMSL